MAEAVRSYLSMTSSQLAAVTILITGALLLDPTLQPWAFLLILIWQWIRHRWHGGGSVLLLCGVLLLQTSPSALPSLETIQGTVTSISARSFILRQGRNSIQVISSHPVVLDQTVRISGELEPIETTHSFYGFDGAGWARQNRISGRVWARHVEEVSASGSLRGWLQRRIESHFDGVEKAVMLKMILGIRHEEATLEILFRCGFHFSLLFALIRQGLGWLLREKEVRRVSWLLLILAGLLFHFPYAWLRIFCRQLFEGKGRCAAQRFGYRWLMLILLAPWSVSSAAFLLPFCFSLMHLCLRRGRCLQTALSMLLQGWLFHTIHPLMLLASRPLRAGMALICCGCWLALCWPPLIRPTVFCLQRLEALFQWCPQLPGQPSLWGIAIIVLLCRLFSSSRRPVVLLVSVILMSVSGLWHPFASMTLIDVGQGDSILIRLPYNRGSILIDTGRSAAFDQVEAMLQGEGIRKLDALILTHEDEDHSGSRDAVLQRYHPEQVIEQIQGPFSIRGLTLYSLNPDTGIEAGNDGSLMLLFSLENTSILLCGDAGIQAEKALLRQFPGLRASIVKLGHHGSRTSSSRSFLETLRPQLALNSSGRNNRYGHPHSEVTTLLENCHIPLLDTQQQGDIRIVFTPFFKILFTAEKGFAIIK